MIDLPKDIQQNKATYHNGANVEHRTYHPKREPDPAAIKSAIDMIANAKKPLFYVGGGVVNSGPEASRLLTEFVRMTGYPCTQTLMGLGAFPGSDPLSLGMVGMHGMYEANWAMHDCDVMINVGARFDDRVTGKLTGFAPHSRKIHIDIDPSSINKSVRVDLPIIGDAGLALKAMIAEWKKRKSSPIKKP